MYIYNYIIFSHLKQIFLRKAFPNEGVPIALHLRMFTSAIEQNGTEIQAKKWLDLATPFKIIGTYAQTELGHGSCLMEYTTPRTISLYIMHYVSGPARSNIVWA